ncbi:MAG TPA: UDP-N-acetylmuramate:L-alanyl-gamma-D-glutamyl-meso-diaminopimelate ligase [Acidobacteriota bacterium]|nr:UDP-N-acetylmuramate:L-alanyl-gamma-D-glutamyl-meso-diaminopimelate ligase [Acidobacteriota bacterium]
MSTVIMGRTVQRIHLLGVCGTAMASLAALLRSSGYTVTGSDADVYPPMSDFLAAEGIPVRSGYAPANLDPPPDLVVVGNAIARGNPELEHALAAGLPYLSMPEVVKLLLLPGKTPVVVTGTHGKTTTSAMAAWALTQLGFDPSFLVGGIPLDFGRSAALGRGPHFVIEGDEYDTAYFDKAPKFFHYRPTVLVITGIEYDHADIYPDLDAIVLQFRRLVNTVPPNGLVVYHADCPRAAEVAARAPCPTVSFGFGGGADWQAESVRAEDGRTRFAVRHRGASLGEAELAVPGRYNVLNALAVWAVLHHAGAPPERVPGALASFRGVERRMTLRGDVGGALLYDDFAHHPTAIQATLAGARLRFPDRRIAVVFEPRSWTCRKRVHQAAMARCFAEADVVILADVFRKEALPEADRFDPARAVADMRAAGQDAHFLPTVAEIVPFLRRWLKPGDVAIIMSNGGFDDIHRRILESSGREGDAPTQP